MSQTETVVTTATTEAAAAAAPATPKAPSKKSLADAIFAALLADRAAGKFATTKEFRAAVLTRIQTELGVSVASAATMYNGAKKAVEPAGISLGRDPKKEKPASTGKRGRPAGSKNRPKAAPADGGTVVVTTPAADAAPAADPVASAEPALM